MMIRKFAVTVAAAISLLGTGAPAQAAPILQLDILGGTYDGASRTIVASDSAFTLVALFTPDAGMLPNLATYLNEVFYISAAASPAVAQPGQDLGSFSFTGDSVIGQQPTTSAGGVVQVTGDMTYGTPPAEGMASYLQPFDPGDLVTQPLYPTYFTEFAFRFSPLSQIATYDSRTDRYSALPVGTGTYAAMFTVNVSDLAWTNQIHFDLYATRMRECSASGTCTDEDIKLAAPFDHDAQSAPIPEPASLLLLSAGLLGTSAATRRSRKNKA